MKQYHLKEQFLVTAIPIKGANHEAKPFEGEILSHEAIPFQRANLSHEAIPFKGAILIHSNTN